MNISVVMPVYNETNNELRQSINSVLKQTYYNFEFIIIDDNPKSLRISNFLQNISYKDNRIKLIFNSKSIGPSKSVNKAVKLSEGDFIARMDADDICRKDRLQKQLKFMLTNNLDLMCSNFSGFFDKVNIYKLKPYYNSTHNVINQNKIKNILSYFNIAMGPTLFFSKNKFLHINGYRKMLSEDYDLIVRFIIHKFRVGYNSSVLLFKRNRRNNLSNEKGLDEFISSYLISKTLRRGSYIKVLSLKELNKKLLCVKNKDKIKFIKFKKCLEKYKRTHSLFYLFKACFFTVSRPILFKRNLWMIFIRLINNNI